MSYETALAALDEKACIAFLSRMVQHKSYSETEGERRLAEHMRDRMAAIGLEAELQPVEGERVNAIGRWKGSGGGSSLLFNGHLDTNPVTGGWTVDPWGGITDDECIYGIGVSNMKAGDAAYFCAVETLMKAGLKPRGDVVLTFVVGELQGGIGTIRAIEQGVRADYFINSEPTDLGALTLHAGAFNWAIELEGITRHVSKREEAVDAIAIAAELVPRLDRTTFTGAANAMHQSVNRCHVGVIRGALSREFHEWRPPQVADFARLLGTGRYAPSQSAEGVIADLRGLLDQLEREYPGLKATVSHQENATGKPSMLPFEVPMDARIVKTVNAAYHRLRGVPQPTGALRPPAFYGTDAAHFHHRLGMEGVVCGPGGKYNTMPDERVELRDYLDCIRLYMMAIIDICGVS